MALMTFLKSPKLKGSAGKNSPNIDDEILSNGGFTLNSYKQSNESADPPLGLRLQNLTLNQEYGADVENYNHDGRNTYESFMGINKSATTNYENASGRGNYQTNAKMNDSATNTYESGLARNNDARNTYESGLARNNDARNTYESGLARNYDARNTYETGLARNNDARNTYENGLARNNDARNTYETGLARNNDARNTYETGLARNNDARNTYENGLGRNNDSARNNYANRSQATNGRLNTANSNGYYNRTLAATNTINTRSQPNYSSTPSGQRTLNPAVNPAVNPSASNQTLPKQHIPRNNISNTSIATDASNYSSLASNYDAPPLLVNTNSSNSDSGEFDSPPMTPNLGTNRSRSNSSPSKRVLSSKMKATPSNLHRYSQIYDVSSSYQNLETQSVQETFNALVSQSRLINENLPPELSPIVNLINCQKLRSYAVGVINIAGNIDNEKIWIEVEAKLTGNELAVWRPSTLDSDYRLENDHDEFKPKYINLIDTKINTANIRYNEITIVHDYKTNSSIAIKFNSRPDLVKWLSAIQLSKFEYVSLNEAYTAVLLSIKGSKLSDIHVLLAPKKRFIKQEWINLRLPQITNKWLKLFMVITPNDAKSYGKIEFYKSDKKMSKKNLIAYISSLNNIFNVFPEQVNMIDFNSIMKLQGEIYINKNFEYIFHSDDADYTPPDRSVSMRVTPSKSSNSISKALHAPSSKKGHTRTNSDNYETSNSFFHNAPGAKLSPPPTPLPKSASRFRLRSLSQGTSSPEPMPRSRSSSFIAKNLDQFSTANYMYIMPITHPGVPAIETMIRNLIYIIDAFKLYGRPSHLISDKTNPNSFLFGLPSLPHYEYFSSDEAATIIDSNLKLQDHSHCATDWRSLFKAHLGPKMQAGYKGNGDIVKLYASLDFSMYEPMANTIASPHINFPRGPSPEDDVFSDMVSDDGLNFNSQVNTQSNDDNLLGAPIDFKRQYNSSPLSNSFSNNGTFSN